MMIMMMMTHLLSRRNL
jgi:hypothetical protein